MQVFDKYTGELSVKRWFRYRVNKRRERLLHKWEKTYYFKQRSISDKFEFEFLSLTPNDDKWHYMSMSVVVWVKKNKLKKSTNPDTKIAEVQVYNDGVEVAKYNIGNPKDKV
jgi:hypothetical protein